MSWSKAGWRSSTFDALWLPLSFAARPGMRLWLPSSTWRRPESRSMQVQPPGTRWTARNRRIPRALYLPDRYTSTMHTACHLSSKLCATTAGAIIYTPVAWTEAHDGAATHYWWTREDLQIELRLCYPTSQIDFPFLRTAYRTPPWILCVRGAVRQSSSWTVYRIAIDAHYQLIHALGI